MTRLATLAICACLIFVTGCFDTIDKPFGEPTSQVDVKRFEGIWTDQRGRVCVVQQDEDKSQLSIGEIKRQRREPRYSIDNGKLVVYQYRDRKFGFLSASEQPTLVAYIEVNSDREMTVASMVSDDQLEELCKQADVEVKIEQEAGFSRHHITDGKKLVDYAIEHEKLDILFPKEPQTILKKLADWPSQ